MTCSSRPGPERLGLGEDALTELVARPGERERRVRVQALRLPVLVAPPIPPGSSGRSSRCSAWRRSRLAGSSGSSAAACPALDAPGGLEARDLRDEVRGR